MSITRSPAAGDCRWTYQQNQAVLTALKKDNKDLKALLAQLPTSNTNGRVSTKGISAAPIKAAAIHSEAICAAQTALESELRGLDLQANSLRKEHDRLVQDRLSCTSKLAQLKDSLKVNTCCCCFTRPISAADRRPPRQAHTIAPAGPALRLPAGVLREPWFSPGQAASAEAYSSFGQARCSPGHMSHSRRDCTAAARAPPDT